MKPTRTIKASEINHIPCEYCSSTFPNKRGLCNHMKKEHPDKEYTQISHVYCEVCSHRLHFNGYANHSTTENHDMNQKLDRNATCKYRRTGHGTIELTNLETGESLEKQKHASKKAPWGMTISATDFRSMIPHLKNMKGITMIHIEKDTGV